MKYSLRLQFGVALAMILILGTLPELVSTGVNEEEEVNLDTVEIDESVYNQIIGKHITAKQEIDKLLEETDMTYLAFYYLKKSKNSFIVANFLISITKKLRFLAEVLLIDCEERTEEEFNLCNNKDDLSSYPRISAYVPPEFRINPYTKKVSSHYELTYTEKNVSEKSIYTFITKNIPARSVRLTSESFPNFNNDPTINKVLLFSNKHQTSLIFKGLSNYFYDRILFGIYNLMH